MYRRATHAGKRVQALGGAKNFVVVMPDADFDRAIDVITESFYGCAGERCLAGSVLLPVGPAHAEARDRLAESARALRVGDGSKPGVAMGPVISAAHRDRVLGYIEKGIAEGARLVLDGRRNPVADRPDGYFLGPTLFDEVSPAMTIGREEIFGPVASIAPVGSLEEAIAVMQAHPNANATSIFTSSGKAAREYARLATASMVGVNIGVAAPLAPFPFGGARDSFFGDLKAHGTGRVRVLHGQEGRDFEMVLTSAVILRARPEDPTDRDSRATGSLLRSDDDGEPMSTIKTPAPPSELAEVREKHKEFLLPATIQYYAEPLVLTEGKGMRIKDVDGNEYLDFFGGILTVSVGHANEKVNAAVDRADHAARRTSRRSIRRCRSVELAEKLARITPGRLKKCFFSDLRHGGRRDRGHAGAGRTPAPPRSSRSATATRAARCSRSR